MSSLISIDPGSEQSAVLEYDVNSQKVTPVGKMANVEVLAWLTYDHQAEMLVVEDTKAYTIPRKKGANFFPEQVRKATFWAGRFVQAWDGPYALMDVRRVKQLLCGVTTVGDAQVRDALLDRFGGTRQKAVGTRKAPGPLYGVKRDLWSALAVAVAYCEEMAVPHSSNCTEGEQT